MGFLFVPCQNCGKLNRIPTETSTAKEPICGHCKSTLPLHFGIAEVNEAGLQTLVKKSPLPVICDFWAPWCGPCKAFAPVFQQAAQRLAPKVSFAKLNTEEHQRASATYSVRGIPTLVLFQNGVEKARLSGAMPLQDFLTWIEQALAQ